MVMGMKIITQKLLHAGLIILSLAAATLIFGCATTPTSEPARYFQLNLTVEIDKKPYDVIYNWHCTEVMTGPNFGGGGLRKAQWSISPRPNIVLKKIENDSVFLFRPEAYCGDGASGFGTDEKTYIPSISLIDSARDPTLMQVFTQRTPHGIFHDVVVKPGTIRRLANPSPDYVASEEEKQLKQLLQDSSHGYHSVSAIVVPESFWGKSDTLKQYLKNAEGILIAPVPTQIRSDIAGRDGKNNFFPVNQAGVWPSSEILSYSIPLMQSDGNIWRLPSFDNFQMASIYIAHPELSTKSSVNRHDFSSPPVSTIDYDGTSIQVLSSQQIFDSKRRLLIQFISRFQPLPWLWD